MKEEITNKNINRKEVNTVPVSSSHNASVTTLLMDAYNMIREEDLSMAFNIIKEARAKDIDHPEARYAEIALERWRSALHSITNNYTSPNARGNKILELWYQFYEEQQSMDTKKLSQNGIEAFQYCVASIARKCYRVTLSKHPEKQQEYEFKLHMYHCLKLMFDYDKAERFITRLCSSTLPSANLYAQLADCHYLKKKIGNAKLIFREAFFIDPSQIKISEIQSQIIYELLHIVRQENRYAAQHIMEWIPIFGHITKIFNITKELTPVEVYQLEQNISTMEVKLRNHRLLGKDNPAILHPRLINGYLRLLEHHKNVSHSNTGMQEILNKIHEFDPHIHKKLLKNS